MKDTRKVNIIHEVTCIIPEKYFDVEYPDVPQEDRDIIEENHGLPCDAGGVLGMWCDRCPYGTVEEGRAG